MNYKIQRIGGGKMTWASPRTCVQKFIPNAYCDACFAVACDYGVSGLDNPAGCTHGKNSDGSGCGWEKNQVFEVNKTTGLCSIKEINAPGHTSDLKCTLISPTQLYHKDVGENGTVIKWTTTTAGGQTFEHEGTIHLLESRSANHS